LYTSVGWNHIATSRQSRSDDGRLRLLAASDLHTRGRPLLYIGISPKATRTDGRQSRQTIRSRIRYHYRGNAYGSTLRLTLGSLLADELGLALRRVGSGTRMTFGHEGEHVLSEWMAAYAKVVWAVVGSPWHVEERLIHHLVLPLNLDQNRHSAFHSTLSAIRGRQRDLARRSPAIAR
jgi:hypothetical protein